MASLPTFPLLASTRRTWLTWAAAATASPWLTACSNNASESPLLATVQWGRQAIAQAMAQTHTRAASVALLHGEHIVWQQGFGTLDVAGQHPTTTETRFNIGSVSKVVAALATLVLVDQGQVELDAPVARYLKDLRMRSAQFADITVRHLLSHSSGLPGTHAHNAVAFAPLSGYAEDLEASLADTHLKHAPGALAVYCNDGFTLIERVVQAVSGMPYTHFVHTQLLAPLGMAHSGFALQPLPSGSVAEVAVNGVAKGQEFLMCYAAGGLSSTPGDMMKLAAMLLHQGSYAGRRILSPQRLAEMATDQSERVRLNLSPTARWGLGWDNVRHPSMDAVGALAWQKNGGTTFFASDFYVLPQAHLALLITANSRALNVGLLAEGILLRALQESGQLAALPTPLQVQVPPIFQGPVPDLAQLLGIYGHSGTPYKVTTGGTGQQLDLWSWSGDTQSWQPKAQGLTLREDGWWYSSAHPEVQYRWQQAEGRRYLLSRQRAGTGHYGFQQPLAQQMPAATAALPAHWAALVGSTWVATNEDPQSVWWLEPQASCKLAEHPELPGYVFWDDSQFLQPLPDGHAGMAVQVPFDAGRDLEELAPEERDGTVWLRSRGMWYRRAS